MTAYRNRYYLLNYLFLVCLLLLVLNDHLFKSVYGNWITGKLSDAAGIIMLPLLIAYLVPRLRYQTWWISAVLFIWWKSPLSAGFIDWYNQFALIPVTRVVDYTDLLVLVLLPLPWFVIHKVDRERALAVTRVHPAVVVMPSMLALMATSPPYYYRYMRSEGNLKCMNCYVTLRYSQDEIVQKLRSAHFEFDSIKPFITTSYTGEVIDHPDLKLYKINQLIIDKDTLRSLDFTMRTIKEGKTRVYFTGMQVDQELGNWRLERQLRKLYRKKVFRELREKME